MPYIRRLYVGFLLLAAAAGIFAQDYFQGSIVLAEFNPLTGLHHEWIGALVFALGVQQVSYVRGWLRSALVMLLAYLGIVAVFYLAGVR